MPVFGAAAQEPKGFWGDVREVEELNGPFFDAVGSVTPDGKTIYVWGMREDGTHIRMAEREKRGEKFKGLRLLPGPFGAMNFQLGVISRNELTLYVTQGEALAGESLLYKATRNDKNDEFGIPDECEPSAVTFIRGDPNDDESINISDAVKILSYLFGGGDLSCVDAADAIDDGAIDIADAVTLVLHLFNDYGDLPEPFGECGSDPTEDQLACEEFTSCP